MAEPVRSPPAAEPETRQHAALPQHRATRGLTYDGVAYGTAMGLRGETLRRMLDDFVALGGRQGLERRWAGCEGAADAYPALHRKGATR